MFILLITYGIILAALLLVLIIAWLITFLFERRRRLRSPHSSPITDH